MSLVIGQLVEHLKYGQGIVLGHEIVRDPVVHKIQLTGRVAVHFEPHALHADPAYCWPQELSPGSEIPFRWGEAKDIPLAWCWYQGATHFHYGWAATSPVTNTRNLPLSEAQMDAYRRGYDHRRATS